MLSSSDRPERDAGMLNRYLKYLEKGGNLRMNHIILEGFVGSGKGAVARVIARKEKIGVIDLDKLVSTRMNMNSAEIYGRFGEAYYRAMETLILDELTAVDDGSVIVLGSGVATMPHNKPYLEKLGKVFYLKLSARNLLCNMKKSSKSHEWVHGEEWEEQVLRIFRDREPSYLETSDFVIEGDGKTTEEIADLIIEEAGR